MDDMERMAAAAGAGMVETYGQPMPRVGDDVWYYRDPENPDAGRAAGMVEQIIGQSTPDPIIVLKHTATGRLVIRKSRIAPPWIPGGGK